MIRQNSTKRLKNGYRILLAKLNRWKQNEGQSQHGFSCKFDGVKWSFRKFIPQTTRTDFNKYHIVKHACKNFEDFHIKKVCQRHQKKIKKIE